MKDLTSTETSSQSVYAIQAELDKLKKKNRLLEEELEDAEDKNKEVVDDLQDRIKKLQDDLSDSKHKSKEYLEEVTDVRNQLDSLEKEFQVREEALDFVKEVLTAKRTDDENISRLYANIDATEQFINGEVRDTIQKANLWEPGFELEFFGQELTSWAISKKKTWIQGKTTIAFVGEFSAGKTSIVNRLLSQDDPNVPLLPTSTKATTAIPTYITGGVGTFYQFVTPNNELKRISEKTFKRVSKEVLDQVKGVSSLIQYFVMTYKNPNLERMSILDTPGFNSNDSEDAERTIEVINECDALFWVFDVNAGTVNRSSLKIIKENLRKPLYIVINQIDTKSKKDVDDVEALITKTLSDEGVNFCGIIRFSKKEPLDNMMGAIRNIKKDNSREVLLDNLIAFMSSEARKASKETIFALRDSNRKKSKVEQLCHEFEKVLSDTSCACNEAKEFPRRNLNWFSEDDYRMSLESKAKFDKLLKYIAHDQVSKLDDLYRAQMEAVSELEEAWKNHSDAQRRQLLLQNCVDLLKQKANLFSVRTASPRFGTSSSDASNLEEESDEDDNVYQQEWEAAVDEWGEYMDANDYKSALLTLNRFYKEHDESPDFTYILFNFRMYVNDYTKGGNLNITLKDIERLIKKGETLAEDEEEIKKVEELWEEFEQLSVARKQTGYHLSESQIKCLINRAKSWESSGGGYIAVNWDTLVHDFNDETGRGCSREEFKSLVGYENKVQGEAILKEDLINNLRAISI